MTPKHSGPDHLNSALAMEGRIDAGGGAPGPDDSALLQEYNLQATLIEALPYPTMLIRRDRTVLFANKAAQEVGARVGGQCWQDFGQARYISDRDKSCLNQHVDRSPGWTHCTFCLADDALDGATQTVAPEIHAFDRIWETYWIPVNRDLYLHFALDITDRKRTEAELDKHREHLEELVEARTAELNTSHENLRRSERLASIGTLAAGIAHEINNPLGLIQLNADSAAEMCYEPGAVVEATSRIEANVDRCARIVRNVLRFSREQPLEKSTISLNEAILQARDFTRELSTRHGVDVILDLSEEIPLILGNSTELEQVFVNLISNAVQASRWEQTVEIRSGGGPEGVWITVRDQGAGMSEEAVRHAFDPFFTTMQHKGGTGLGLSVSHGIITGMGGTISIESSPGEGTTITLSLPAVGP